MADRFDKAFLVLLQWVLFLVQKTLIAAVRCGSAPVFTWIAWRVWNGSSPAMQNALSGFSRWAGAARAAGRWPEVLIPSPARVRAVPPAPTRRRRT
jgi:hypothetical protein